MVPRFSRPPFAQLARRKRPAEPSRRLPLLSRASSSARRRQSLDCVPGCPPVRRAHPLPLRTLPSWWTRCGLLVALDVLGKRRDFARPNRQPLTRMILSAQLKGSLLLPFQRSVVRPAATRNLGVVPQSGPLKHLLVPLLAKIRLTYQRKFHSLGKIIPPMIGPMSSRRCPPTVPLRTHCGLRLPLAHCAAHYGLRPAIPLGPPAQPRQGGLARGHTLPSPAANLGRVGRVSLPLLSASPPWATLWHPAHCSGGLWLVDAHARPYVTVLMTHSI